MERQLLTAEKLSALAAWLGSPRRSGGDLARWEPVLFNQTHDLASGVMTDHVYDDTIASYEYRHAPRRRDHRLAMGGPRRRGSTPAGRARRSSSSTPLGWPRTDIAEVERRLRRRRRRRRRGDRPRRAEPCRSRSSSRPAMRRRPEDGACCVRRARRPRAWATRSITSPRAAGSVRRSPAAKALDGRPLENELYRLTLDRSTGAMTSLRVKAGDWEVLAGPGNVVSRAARPRRPLGAVQGPRRRQPDRDDDASSRSPGAARRSSATKDKGRAGNAAQRARSSPSSRVARPFGTGRFATTVRLYNGSAADRGHARRLVNQEKYVRYQVLFPTTIADGKSTHEIPFGAIDRPEAIEFPAQNWVDYGDGRRGLALLNIGLPGNLVTDGTMMVSLLRPHTLGAYGFGGGYEPGMSSDTGFQLDRADGSVRPRPTRRRLARPRRSSATDWNSIIR